MGWRTVVINSLAKISCKNGYLCVQGEEVTMIHLSEVDSLIIGRRLLRRLRCGSLPRTK